MKQTAVISIIMPLYNAECFLEEALESILKQTFEAFEVLCINDASTDSTKEILKKFCQRDSRVIIVENEERAGAACSRNKGLSLAQGEFVTFLDGDDIFDENLLQEALTCAREKNADIVVYETMHVESEQIHQKKVVQRRTEFLERFCTTPFSVTKLKPSEFMKISDSPWSKLYRSELIKKHQLEFQTLSCANDVFFVRMALFLADRIIWLNDRRVMVYAREHFVPTRISFNRDPMCVYQAIRKLGEELVDRKMMEVFFQHFCYCAFCLLKDAPTRCKDAEMINVFCSFMKKEGVQNLIDILGEDYDSVPPLLASELMNFQTLNFSDGWMQEFNFYLLQLEEKKDEIRNLIVNCYREEKRIVLWGAGRNGMAFVKFLEQYQMEITAIVDKDNQKKGMVLGSYRVDVPEHILQKGDVILFTSDAVHDEMKADLESDYQLIRIS